MHKVLFTVSLSNGETIHEERGNFKRIKGALSPWERLLSYIRDNDLKITSLALYHPDGRRWNLPSSGNSPKFHAFSEADKPLDYAFCRKAGIDKCSTTHETLSEDIYAVGEVIYSDHIIQVWVHNETGVSWILSKKNDTQAS